MTNQIKRIRNVIVAQKKAISHVRGPSPRTSPHVSVVPQIQRSHARETVLTITFNNH